MLKTTKATTKQIVKKKGRQTDGFLKKEKKNSCPLKLSSSFQKNALFITAG